MCGGSRNEREGVSVTSCVADCDNLILQLMLIAFHCAAIPGDPHTCYNVILPPLAMNTSDVCFTQLGNLFLVINVTFILDKYLQSDSFMMQINI